MYLVSPEIRTRVSTVTPEHGLYHAAELLHMRGKKRRKSVISVGISISAKRIRLWTAPLCTVSPPRVPASPPGGPRCSAARRRRLPGLPQGEGGGVFSLGRQHRCRRCLDVRGNDAAHGGGRAPVRVAPVGRRIPQGKDGLVEAHLVRVRVRARVRLGLD